MSISSFVQEGLQKLGEHETFDSESRTREGGCVQAQSCQVGDAQKYKLSP